MKKQIVRVDLWPTDIEGNVDLTVYWRADNRTQWQLWGTVSVCADMDNADGQLAQSGGAGARENQDAIGPDKIDVIDNQQADMGYGFQVRNRMDRESCCWTESTLGQSRIFQIELLGSHRHGICLRSKCRDKTRDFVLASRFGGLGGPTPTQNGRTCTRDQNGTPYTGSVILQ